MTGSGVREVGEADCTQDQMNHNNCQSVVSLLNREIHNYMILTLKLVSRYHTYPPLTDD